MKKMNLVLIIIAIVLLSILACAGTDGEVNSNQSEGYNNTVDENGVDENGNEDITDINSQILPEEFKVYVKDNVVINWPAEGYEERTLPVYNLYTDTPGCYIAAYSHNENEGVYSVGGDIYVMGMVRVEGTYEGRVCQPASYENEDISSVEYFKEMFSEYISGCEGNTCWAGGDTSGFIGIQPENDINNNQ